MAAVRLISRDDAARMLSSASGEPVAELLASSEVVHAAYDRLAAEHPGHGGCQRVFARWRDILLGDVQPVTDPQGRLL